MDRVSSGRLGPTSTLSTDQLSMPLPVRISAPGLAGQGAKAGFVLSAGSCVVGASPDADLIISDATVSREHLRVDVIPEGVRVSDLGSRNGTFYGGHRISEMVLSAAASLRLGRAELSIEFDTTSLQSAEERRGYGSLQGRSAAMRQLFAKLKRLEGSLVSILLMGESGSGKELIARTMHENSEVSDGPMIALNCGALERQLVRSELFGHRKGAFTGAVEHRAGAFQRAHGGTLFLDEVGELPLEVQPVMLRALQEREVVPVGETTPTSVRVRLIAATHRDLQQMVQSGEFREDLYYRLNVVRLDVPPLRDRPEDIEPLALAAARQAGIAELPRSVLSQLCQHHWPGNVRELMHAVEAYAAVGELPSFQPLALGGLGKALADHIDLDQPYDELKQRFNEVFQEAYLRQLLAVTGGNISQAARQSGLERSYLSRLVSRYKLR
jgi:two-component system, NtrC family, nitrogen regulation response regulator GlnG